MKKTKITALALAAAIALPVVSNSFADDADLYEEEVFVIEGEKYLDDDGFDYDDDDDDDDDDRYDDDDDYVRVPKSYKYIKEGSYKKRALRVKRNNLKKAVKRSRLTVSGAEYLIKNTPNTISSVRKQLDRLIANSKRLTRQADATIAEYDKLLNR